MINITPGTNCWHVHRDGKVLCTTQDPNLAHTLAGKFQTASSSGTMESVEVSGLDCFLNDVRKNDKLMDAPTQDRVCDVDPLAP